MGFEVTRGVVEKPQRVLLYGPEGIGKTTLAARFPSPLFIDTEGGSGHLDVPRLPVPDSWQMLLDEVAWVRDFPGECGGTLVIDTMDWAESLCAAHVCKKQGKSGIEDFGYGKGYTYLKEEFSKLLRLLSDVCDRGLNVCATAHACIQKFEQPDEMGAYDRWELKLTRKHVAPMVKEWADAVLFCNYKTIVVTTDRDGKVGKAMGGKNRVIYATHAATWDAKNRWGLADEVPMEWAQIAPHVPVPSFGGAKGTGQAATKETNEPDVPFDTHVEGEPEPSPHVGASWPDHLQPLARLMERDGVTGCELVEAMARRGYKTRDTPIESWDPSFAEWAVSAWEPIRQYISSGMPDE